MEKIYKKICLESSRSRSQGLMPFIKYGDSGLTFVDETEVNGNWGGYPGNPIDYSGKTYMDVMFRYFEIWKQLRNGVYLKKIVVNSRDCDCAPYGISWTEQFKEDKDTYDFVAFDKKYFYFDEKYGTYFLVDEMLDGLENEEFIVLVEDPDRMKECANYLDFNEDWGKYCRFVDDTYLGKIEVPADKVKLGDRVPYVMYYADIPQYLQWMRDNENSDDCCIRELWKKRGGSEFMSYLEGLEGKYEEKINAAQSLTDEEHIPTIDISLALRQNFADEGAYVTYNDTWYNEWDGDENIGYVVPESAECEYHPSFAKSVDTEWDNINPISGDSSDKRGALSWPYSVDSTRKTYEDGEEIEVPSYLQNMMHTPYFYDDNRVMIPGTLRKFGPDGDGFFECTYYQRESKQPAITTTIRITYKLDNDRTYSTTINQGCTQEEITAWPQNQGTYQIVSPKIYESRVTETQEETTGQYAVGQTYNGHEIIASTTYHTETYGRYGWWEAVKVPFNVEEYVVSDGEGTLTCKNEKKYRVLTMLEAIDSLVPSDFNVDEVGPDGLADGDVYYFLVTYDNGPIHPSETRSCDAGSIMLPVGEYIPADIPFDLGNVLNIKSLNDEGTEVMGDSVLSADTATTPSSITLTYVIGGKFNNNGSGYSYIEDTGVILEETHDYEEAKAFTYSIDGVSSVTVYCNYIDFESDKKIGVSSYNGLSGLCNTSLIKAMDVGDVMVSPSGSTRSVIYKEDYLLGVSYEPETDIDVSYDNGTATAWEKHFKLGECNTMSDLVNYGNHEFGLNN